MKNEDLRLNVNGVSYTYPRLVEGKKRWYILYYVTNLETGNLERKRKYIPNFKTKSEKRQHSKLVIKDLAFILHNGATSNLPAPAPSKNLNTYRAFEQACRKRLKGFGENTAKNYSSFWNIFSSWLIINKLDKRNISLFKTPEVLKFLDYLIEEREVGPTTRNNYRNRIRALFNIMIRRGIIDANPAQGVPDLPEVGTQNIPFSKEEQQITEDYMKRVCPWFFYYTRFIYYCFMRPIDVCRMRRRDIDLKNRIILIMASNTKNKRQLPVYITPGLLKIIEEMNIEKVPGHFFLFGKKKHGYRPGPEPEHRNKYTAKHAEILKACELDGLGINLYSWKHTGNCRALDAGWDIMSIKNQNRHSDLNQTEIYLRSLRLVIKEDIKNIDW